MRLVFDVQGAQATNRFRGIGRYVLELVKAMLRTRGHHEVVFMANGAFEESVEALRAEIKDLAPANTIRVWMPPQPCRALENPSSDRVVAAKLAYETFANSLKPDVFLIGSVFDGFVDDAAISIGRLPRRCHVAAVLFDLIPLIHANVYLDGNERFRTWYTNQLSELRKADALLAISKSSAQEAVEYLNWPAHRVHPIMGACSSQFRRIGLGDSQCSELLARFGINRPFLMYTGGIDYRKNIEGLISAYARLPLHIRQSHQLAIVCHADAASVTRLQNEVRLAGLHQEEVIFTGFVSDEELVKLYNACKVFIFPSWHEGFGLPALEAMACGRAVLASNTTSLPEIVGRADALFDPYDPADMARVITRALTDDAFRAELEAHALKQSAQFS
ncbi:MAG: glycosyltransferase family 4 protein, partial [Casimicrobiaceae bacterium]|nr:glycosyltransferase family 4 protein [Casimicrobiaceae bacterium]